MSCTAAAPARLSLSFNRPRLPLLVLALWEKVKAMGFCAVSILVVLQAVRALHERHQTRGVGVLFADEELKEMVGLKKGEDFVEVTCGCTSPRYGDAVGRLRVFASGKLEITCECFPGCSEDKLTPAAFEKHSGRETQRRWKYYVWVIVKGKKVPLLKTTLLKYHEKVYGRRSHKGNKGRPFHRDEFVCCSRCNKERRFRFQTQLECRTYHDAVLDPNWKCSDLPSEEYTCDDEEERSSRRTLRGCSRSPLCKGCTLCVCFGCDVCRFPDCSCQACIDFVNNAAN